jgi:hypothetical protein
MAKLETTSAGKTSAQRKEKEDNSSGNSGAGGSSGDSIDSASSAGRDKEMGGGGTEGVLT